MVRFERVVGSYNRAAMFWLWAFFEGVIHSLIQNRWWPLILLVGLAVVGSILVAVLD